MPKLSIASGAALKFPSPACEAVIVQVPGATIVTVEPDTVQTPVVDDENATVRPELAVAVSATVPPDEKVCEPGFVKLIVWFAGSMVTTCVTCGAAL